MHCVLVVSLCPLALESNYHQLIPCTYIKNISTQLRNTHEQVITGTESFPVRMWLSLSKRKCSVDLWTTLEENTQKTPKIFQVFGRVTPPPSHLCDGDQDDSGHQSSHSAPLSFHSGNTVLICILCLSFKHSRHLVIAPWTKVNPRLTHHSSLLWSEGKLNANHYEVLRWEVWHPIDISSGLLAADPRHFQLCALCTRRWMCVSPQRFLRGGNKTWEGMKQSYWLEAHKAVFRKTASVVLGDTSLEKGDIRHPLPIKSILGRNYRG